MRDPDSDSAWTDTYRVLLLRLWREKPGPWHASLQAAADQTARRFADMDALIAYLQKLHDLPYPQQPTDTE